MRRYLIIIAGLLSLLSPAAQAANSTVSALTAAGAIADADLLYCVQSAADRKCTPLQLANYIFGKVSGDLTCTATGGCTLKATGPGALGPIGSTTTAPSVTIDAQGRVTGLSSNNIAFPVSSVTAGCGLTVSPTTGAVVASATVTARNNTLTTDTIAGSDCGAVVTENNASPVAVGIAAAGSAGFLANTPFSVKNKGAGLVTITPTTSTIDGAANLTLSQNQSVDFYSDGTNYIPLPGRSPTGTTSTIASGTAALGVAAIPSAACATVVTTSAPNTATTDVVTASFNGDPTAVTGYIPATTGMLTVIVYPTAGFANFKVCNNTASSITPGAITLNWRVVR